MTNQFYGVFIGVNEYLDGRNLRSLQFAGQGRSGTTRTMKPSNVLRTRLRER